MQVTVTIDFSGNEDELRAEYISRRGLDEDTDYDDIPDLRTIAEEYVNAVLADPEIAVVESDLIYDWTFDDSRYSANGNPSAPVVRDAQSSATAKQLDFHNRQHIGSYNDCKMLH